MNILVVGSGGPEIQVNVPVVEHVPRGVNIVKFNIRAGFPEVRQHVFGQAGAPVLLAENLDRNTLRHAPQQVERLYILRTRGICNSCHQNYSVKKPALRQPITDS